MDSIKSKVIRAPQRSGHKVITFADISSAGTYNAANSDKFKIIVPKGARILATPMIVVEAWNNIATTVTGNTGFPANSFEDDGTAANGGTVLADAYHDGTTMAMKTKARYGDTAQGTAANVGTHIGKKATYVVDENNENEYSVHLTVVATGAGTATQGEAIWWVEYAFDPNIVWDQDSLV